MKPERWGSPLVQEKYQEEQACDKRHPYRMMMMIIIIIIIVIIIIRRIRMANEICGMWKQKAAQVIPIVISSTGVIPKSLSQNLSRLNLHPNTYIQLQKSVILGTCSIVRNFLNYK